MAHNPHIKDSISARGGAEKGAASADFSVEKNDQAQSAGQTQGAGRVQGKPTARKVASNWGVRLGALAFWLAVWQVAAVVINQDIVLTSPFEINEGMKQKYFWLSNLFHYFNKYFKDKDKKYNKYFLDNWFAINSVIVYNPLTMKREVYYAKHFDQSFPEVELLKILSIIENKLQVKHFYGGNCDYCESRLFCSVYAFNYPAQSKVMKEKQDFYKETKIII